jgi:hypothetical protein
VFNVYKTPPTFDSNYSGIHQCTSPPPRNMFIGITMDYMTACLARVSYKVFTLCGKQPYCVENMYIYRKNIKEE